MLISCPKCHSIYEIPDDLIGKTGQKFRCQACSNIWHAMRSDALGYEEEKEDEEPYIEPIEVTEPPARPWPSEKKEFIIPADSKSGRKTPSSSEVIKKEGDPNFIAPVMNIQDTPSEPQAPLPPHTLSSAVILDAAQKQNEITLTSDTGTSFTISTAPMYEDKKEDTRREPHLFAESDRDFNFKVTPDDRLDAPKPFKGYRKTCALFVLLLLCAGILFLRREIVTFFPIAETYYNKIGLSGLYNEEYLKFSKISVNRILDNKKPVLKVTAEIKNTSFYTSYVPQITVNNQKERYAPEQSKLKGGETTRAVFTLPAQKQNTPVSLTLNFAKP